MVMFINCCVETRSDTWLRWGVCLSSVWWWGSDDVQVCLMNTQVKWGAGVWWLGWRTDGYVTLPSPPGRRVPCHSINTGEGGREVGLPWRLMQDRDTGKASRVDLRLRWPRLDRSLRWPWRIRGLGRPWRIRSLGWPWCYYLLVRSR